MKKLLILTFVFTTFLQAEFILKNDSIVLEKAAVKIEEMSKELYEKTGITANLSAQYKLPEGMGITQQGQAVAKDLKAPYALIIFSASDKQIDSILSEDLKDIDKDEILDTYVIPLLVTYNKKVSQTQKYSAGLLNGMAELTDRLAKTKNIVLESSIGSESKDTYEVIAMIVKIMMILTVFAVGRIWYTSRKG